MYWWYFKILENILWQNFVVINSLIIDLIPRRIDDIFYSLQLCISYVLSTIDYILWKKHQQQSCLQDHTPIKISNTYKLSLNVSTIRMRNERNRKITIIMYSTTEKLTTSTKGLSVAIFRPIETTNSIFSINRISSPQYCSAL